MTADRDVVDEIDALVDAQMEQTRSGYDYNLAQDHCPHCGREWHGLAITERMEQMRQRFHARQIQAQMRAAYDGVGEQGYAGSVIDADYRYADDDSRVLCPGSSAPQPARRPPAAPAPVRVFNDAWEQIASDLDLRIGLNQRQPFVVFRDDAAAIQREERRSIEFTVQFAGFNSDLLELLLGDRIGPPPEHFGRNVPAYAEGGGFDRIWLDEYVNSTPDRESEPPVENPPQWRHLPPLPRPSTSPPMWANTPQSRRRNRRQDNR